MMERLTNKEMDEDYISLINKIFLKPKTNIFLKHSILFKILHLKNDKVLDLIDMCDINEIRVLNKNLEEILEILKEKDKERKRLEKN